MSGFGAGVALRLTLLGVGAGVGPWSAADLTRGLRHPASARFADLLAAAGAWLLLACAVWWAVCCLAVAAEVLTSGRVRAAAWTGCPATLHRLVTAALGLALAGVASPVAPAAAAAVAAGTRTHQACHPGPAADLPVPTRGARVRHTAPARQRITVRPGDTLWDLAAEHLRAPTPRRTADLTTRLHLANRAVIGDDPGLIHPGQRLLLPRAPRLRGGPPTFPPTPPAHTEETP